jgi:hypothetical protein
VPVPNLAGRPAVLRLAEHRAVLRAVSLVALKGVSKRVDLRPVALLGVLVAKVPRQVWPLVLAVVPVAHHKIVVGWCRNHVAVLAHKRHRVLRVLLV